MSSDKMSLKEKRLANILLEAGYTHGRATAAHYAANEFPWGDPIGNVLYNKWLTDEERFVADQLLAAQPPVITITHEDKSDWAAQIVPTDDMKRLIGMERRRHETAVAQKIRSELPDGIAPKNKGAYANTIAETAGYQDKAAFLANTIPWEEKPHDQISVIQHSFQPIPITSLTPEQRLVAGEIYYMFDIKGDVHNVDTWTIAPLHHMSELIAAARNTSEMPVPEVVSGGGGIEKDTKILIQ